ncbi:S1 domain-containing RNA-binding protein [Marinilactibacillus psychrotolerans]|uniref:RNA-binding protein S1 n=2 Tax=Marinilactibacillus psychrotolerans TaxID=191770 RepID=A0A511GXM8_9LACT|nr:S1 domain-containing RNA-binding protein [Marinilactibacillus psychrotolerans]TLQ08167.1 RNA-binding protein S1 [Marinilactibacillus psychrotolerans]SDC15226.1 S1 RNA binding domain protein [Marinilactibacillus psychrotolerans]SJN16899.1 RNA binding protein, contains ribosomal protein S1 domain [Marinilactibacillus psychrotolerans 42ea]GEL66010.1 RNA-binding protein S1 [Marinilactibacillus psychrotolerans]GEQ32412.1 S1 RNA-binding protein [Marinilactibacillus psychrotolerans]
MSIEVGSKVEGKVTGIANFGAFIDLGDKKTGLVHISEVSDNYVENINEVLEVGQTVMVKVLSIADDGKIGLSIRKAQDKPAEEAPKKKVPQRAKSSSNSNKRSNFSAPKKEDFDSLMNSFLKDSEDRLTSLKRNTENKRGGRGGRRG